MTITETRRLLTIIWSLFPNAPRLTQEDKGAMAVAWFSLLYEYSFADVWFATRDCLSRKPNFIPSCPEIAKIVCAHFDVDAHLPPNFDNMKLTENERNAMIHEAVETAAKAYRAIELEKLEADPDSNKILAQFYGAQNALK